MFGCIAALQLNNKVKGFGIKQQIKGRASLAVCSDVIESNSCRILLPRTRLFRILNICLVKYNPIILLQAVELVSLHFEMTAYFKLE